MRCRNEMRTTLLVATTIWCVSAAAAAELDLRVIDLDAERPVPARVRVRDDAGVDHVPDGAQAVPLGSRDRWFASGGRTQLDVPAGIVEVRIERGPAYRPIKRTIRIEPGVVNRYTFRLERWIDMRRRGYTCGENHLHVPIEQLGSQLAAEDLDFGTSLQWWNGPRYTVPPGDGFVRDLTFAGVRVPTSVYDIEIEHAWGAVYIIGMPRALDAKSDGGMANLPIVREAHDAGALVCYQGGWSREVLVDALLGCVDVVNVCNNNFHRHQFQPRSRYSNLLEVEGLPTYPDTPLGMMQMNTDTYYRLLNCGLRLAAGAGSATGAKKTPVGYNRAYVRAGDHPTLAQFLEAWRRGRNFVTCGPMIFLTVDGTHRPGDTIALPPTGGELRVHVEAVSEQPITGLEIVVNGQVIERAPSVSGTSAVLSATMPVREGAWIAARCTEEDGLLDDAELGVHDYGGRMARRPCRLRFAHTSPVYVTVGGNAARVPASVAEAKRMLDAFETFARKTARETHLPEILAEVSEARRRLGE